MHWTDCCTCMLLHRSKLLLEKLVIRKGGSVLDIAEGREKQKTTAAGMTGDELIQLLKTSDEGKDLAQSGVVDDEVRLDSMSLRPRCCSLSCSACLQHRCASRPSRLLLHSPHLAVCHLTEGPVHWCTDS